MRETMLCVELPFWLTSIFRAALWGRMGPVLAGLRG
jgi:hypothetical protein